jgi:hypothetical protein
MPEPPRRKRFQIHLSTAMVMMFVAAAIIWANVRSVHYWPIDLVTSYSIDSLIPNLFVWSAILIATWFLCEWPIRRRVASAFRFIFRRRL